MTFVQIVALVTRGVEHLPEGVIERYNAVRDDLRSTAQRRRPARLERGRTTALNAIENPNGNSAKNAFTWIGCSFNKACGKRSPAPGKQRSNRRNGRPWMPRGALMDGYRPVFADDAAGRAVKYADERLGKVYQWGADGPDSDDCTGLTMAAWKEAGVVLPHNGAPARLCTDCRLWPADYAAQRPCLCPNGGGVSVGFTTA